MKIKCKITTMEENNEYWAKLEFTHDRELLKLDEDLLNNLGAVIVDIFNKKKNYKIENNQIICNISKYQYKAFDLEDEITQESIEECCNLAEISYEKQLSRNQ